LLVTLHLQAKPLKIQSAILWKVSDKDMQKPSQLFGKFLLLINVFPDTIPAVLQAYRQADKVVIVDLLQEKALTTSINKVVYNARCLKAYYTNSN